jgi:catechol 2,3-dioxygenase-like lactoylglutathione lyase family enzyme
METAFGTVGFGSKKRSFMLNFRVRDLPAMVKQLQDAGIGVELDSHVYPNGVFARFRDPDGNPIAIWQPKGDELSLPNS